MYSQRVSGDTTRAGVVWVRHCDLPGSTPSRCIYPPTETRHEYVPIGSAANILLAKVSVGGYTHRTGVQCETGRVYGPNWKSVRNLKVTRQGFWLQASLGPSFEPASFSAASPSTARGHVFNTACTTVAKGIAKKTPQKPHKPPKTRIATMIATG